MPATNSQGNPMPTSKQIEVFEMAIEAYKDTPAKIETEMDDHGAMYLYIEQDEARCFCLFDRSGNRYGDWVW